MRSFGQSYGLGFYSHEVVQDQRTGLDLSPDKTFCFSKNFELSFDLTFLPKRDDYFGYILRFVVDDHENIDLIYDKASSEKNHFKLIIGDKFSKVAFNLPPDILFSKWNKIRISFDIDKKTLTLTSGKYSSSTLIPVKQNTCFKILFGANVYKSFKTADIPPMKIRNISISESGQKKYAWPLDESDGSVAKEVVKGNDGSVSKPLWIKKMHYEWQLLKTINVNGPASAAFDNKNEIVYLVGSDSLKIFSVRDQKLAVKPYQNQLNLLRGNNSLFDTQHKRLINIYTDQHSVSVYNFNTDKWSKNYSLPTPITDYWLYNKFYSATDSSLYVLGGYGHFIYKNEIQRYHFPSQNWEKIKVTGDNYTPRYLAALGYTGKGAYIIGGYGSTTGKQMLNPKNLYDLLYFDVQQKTIKKVYELNVTGEDFVFANSLIINQKDDSYYALIFPKHKYKSELQLIHGSLKNPVYTLAGSKIPFLFHDINSSADLYYCEASQRFIAVTTFRNENDQTQVKIYSLSSSPLPVPVNAVASASGLVWYILGGIIVVAGIVIVLLKRKKSALAKVPEIPAAEIKTELQQAATTQQAITPVLPVTVPVQESQPKGSIFLFGDLQVYDDDGNEITKQFTPLIKELFLIILLYTIRWERGISSDKLKELLWFDKSAESARNNRSVNIAKLKSILEKVSDCQISKETGYWRINFNSQQTYVDYQEYINLVKDKKQLSKEKITALAKLIKRGSFLSIVSYEWIDAFKSEISNEIIDTYLQYARSVDISADPELLIELANYIFYFDSVNEEAMAIKCKALVYLGKHSLAKHTFENFCKEYKLLYDADFDKTFSDILQTNTSLL